MKKPSLIFLSLAIATSPLFAGTLYRIENRIVGSEKTEMTQLTVAGNDLKIHTESESEVTMIYRGTSDEIIIVDHAQETYMTLDRETLEGLAGMMSDAMRQMEAALANVPAEQRAMIEEMMQGQMSALGGGEPKSVREISNTGDSGKVGGVSCSWKEITRDGELDLKVCVSDWEAIDKGEDLLAAFRDMEAFYSSMLDTLSSAGGPMAAMTEGFEQGFMSEMVLADGFPLMTEDYEDGEITRSSRYLGSQSVEVSAEDFAAPSGYRRNELPRGRR
jgi:hypothetical protein